LHVRGTIFFVENFQFYDGETSDKLLILLNTPTGREPCFCVRTTSQKKDKPLRPGCIQKRSLFFIPKGTHFFKDNTWVQLYDQYPLQPEYINTRARRIDEIGNKVVDAIIDCLFKSEGHNISPIIEKLLRPPIENSLLKLQEKFSKNH